MLNQSLLTPRQEWTGRAVVDGPYRYRLMRSCGGDAKSILWIMLNPSLADATKDDPTIRRIKAFSVAAGAGGFTVVNLFALTSPDPTALLAHKDPVGRHNDSYIRDAAHGAQKIVCAWGANQHARSRVSEVLGLLSGFDLYCLGTTKDGFPRHPLYVKGGQQLMFFREALHV